MLRNKLRIFVAVYKEDIITNMKKVSLLFSMFFLLLISLHFNLNAQTQIIVHRGYWNTIGSAQNSITALIKADSLHIYGSETDVWLSTDGVPMVNHDDSILCNGRKISVQDSDSKTLKSIILKNGENLPTLEAYLNAFEKCKHTKLIIELKKHRTKNQEDELTSKVLKMIRKRRLQNRVEYISFGLNFTTKLIQLDPSASVYYLNGDLSPRVMKEIGAAGIDYHYSVIYKHPEWVEMAHKLGLKVNVWTVDKPEDIQKMLDLKVDFITTNDPLLVKKMQQQ